MFFNFNKMTLRSYFTVIVLAMQMPVFAQTEEVILTNKVETVSNYVDQNNGKTANELVVYALANNAELEAVRREVEAAEALIKQADLRANPNLELSGSKNPVTPSNSLMVKGFFAARTLRSARGACKSR